MIMSAMAKNDGDANEDSNVGNDNDNNEENNNDDVQAEY
jgi:hypothetical protein